MNTKTDSILAAAERLLRRDAEELREGASYESMNLAAMVLSDCGHSSNYKPLLERVAGRIDRHVERLLTAQREDLTTRAQAAPAAVTGPIEMHEAMCPALTGGRCTCERNDPAVDKAWARFCGKIGDGPDAPYPGMIPAFERYYSQSFTDRDWRNEASVWAAAWKQAMLIAAAPTTQAAPQPAVQHGDSDSACARQVWWTHNKAKFTTTRQSAFAAWDGAVEWRTAAQLQEAAPAAQGDALIDFIESAGSVHIHRVRAGFNGPIRWDVEYGYEDAKVSGRTLRDALSGVLKAGAASAAKEGAKHG